MNEFRTLLDRFWVTRWEDRELYFALKRAQPDYRRLVNEALGWNLIVNESVVKLEKVPPRAMPWMGIQSFQEPMDYCLLCALLLFLADLDDGAPFLLSSLTKALGTFLAEIKPVDWTQFLHRKALVRVLQYAQETGLVVAYDGNSAGFGGDQNQEVLYENTGLSRHFPVHFGRDTLQCRSIEDFEALSGEGDNTERRRHRVYQQLALSPGVYCSPENQSDYEYACRTPRRRNGKRPGASSGAPFPSPFAFRRSSLRPRSSRPSFGASVCGSCWRRISARRSGPTGRPERRRSSASPPSWTGPRRKSGERTAFAGSGR